MSVQAEFKKNFLGEDLGILFLYDKALLRPKNISFCE